ncbi:MAG: hypothetical protein A2900_06075 [Candidatus Chisholmbacteria bacterium RIFCSPLOWO2_01_FULL_50_28]|uniref:Septum formation initiator n=1 Tax=Candidatus Chisholmbacteria bacterium RIFCSPHIGHO2_01_FULL_52_32 TaxID=1797591 RepID=A0A1G1VQW3_9BACT|nr:MAG: hypothetical protein A2786_00450 [Candidatus Chisholmbacteria bacterium RIFCSPHIGHO2_01_FULL_52_32]OGY20683.1 MAG: hypothetical protein A2900_06075 [Candidatus Chisholmbacteria bacterium RIFCSPLOWO2_01_FULL_50_28]
MRRQAFSILALLLGIYFIVALSRDLLDLLSKRERIIQEEAEVAKLEQEQRDLAEKLQYVSGDEFVEKEAREKLLMGKPGEVVMLLPPDNDQTGQAGPTSDKDQNSAKEDLANWEKWAQVFGFFR